MSMSRIKITYGEVQIDIESDQAPELLAKLKELASVVIPLVEAIRVSYAKARPAIKPRV
jgi:hypothetical protein